MSGSTWVARSLLAGALVSLLCSAASAGSIVYVDDDAPAGGDGTSWATAFRFLQDGLAFAAVPQHGVTEVRVAQGVYKPDRSEASPGGTGDRAASFNLVRGVGVYGGFDGRQTSFEQRDPKTNLTVLSGDLNDNDVGDPTDPSHADNTYHVVRATGVSASTVLDGLTIAGGNANQGGAAGRGGGLYQEGGRAYPETSFLPLSKMRHDRIPRGVR